MAPPAAYDAVIVGSGPNGLAAAITLARAGRSVQVIEGRDTIGGGMRSAELTLPGYHHDVCSAVHPLGAGSPFFASLPLEEYGLRWIEPPAALAHPFDDGTAAVVTRSIEMTGRSLGEDAASYDRLVRPLVASWHKLAPELLGPLRVPHHPVALAQFGLLALWPAAALARRRFRGSRARALLAGMAAHAILPLERAGTAAFGLVLAVLAHAVGWPIPERGSQSLADALASYLHQLGGEIVTGRWIAHVDELPPHRVALFDVTPRQLLEIAGDRLTARDWRRLGGYRYGPGVFKMDFALDGPVPWRADDCTRAATLHLGGTLEEIAAAERAVWQGEHPERPFVLVAQPSLFDASRAPEGRHTLWAYCHVPHASTVDMASRIEAQIERFAPGFRDRVLARCQRHARDMEQYNPNYVGGDISGGVQDLGQLFTRPVARLVPYATSARGLYLCSSSTPPGGGVHGMAGYHAARAALRRMTQGRDVAAPFSGRPEPG